MKKFRFHLLLTALIALLSACGSDSDSPDKILPLPVPASLVSEGDEASLTFTWEAVPDAKCYAYRFNEGDEVYTNETSVRFDGLTNTASRSRPFRATSAAGATPTGLRQPPRRASSPCLPSSSRSVR